MNLTSMNGERRMRLTERYMDPPGSARPDCLIVAGLAQALEKSWRGAGKNDIADKFKGYDWKTEEDAFMDGYNKHAEGGSFVTYERLRAMGTNGFQEPAVDLKDGKIIGTKRLYADGKFGKDGKAKFMATQWRGLEAPGRQQEKEKFLYLVNNYEPRDRYDDDQQRTHRENRVASMAAPRVRSSCSIKPEMVFLIRSQTLAIIRCAIFSYSLELSGLFGSVTSR